MGLLTADPGQALDQAAALLSEQAEPRAFRLSAAALRALGRQDEAEHAELQAIRASFSEPLRRARAAQQAGRSAEAKDLADACLRSDPDDLLAMTLAAEANLRLGDRARAEEMLRRVVERAPAFPPASLLLADALGAQLRLREAAAVLEKLLGRVPTEHSAKRYLADLRTQMNDPSAAASLLEDILSTPPRRAADQLKYAQVLRVSGRKGESISALRDATAASPAAARAWWALANYFPDALSPHDEQQISSTAQSSAIAPADRAALQSALSILEHRRGNHAAAFNAITAAKALAPNGPSYDSDALTRHIDQMIAAYSAELFAQLERDGSQSEAPIFIVGMPRSGSTLLERILGQHSAIEAAGELPLMPRLVAMESPAASAAHRSLMPEGLTGEAVSRLAEWYLERSQEYRHTGKPRFTDKYNGNWIRTGLIRLMFPAAKILDIRRDPLDCCWSVFRSVLGGDYAGDQRDLARYYADYVRFMDAMVAASPKQVLTVRYEALVSDVEGQTREILDFLGLEFQRACVDFHLSTAAVTTASSEQVRRPINTDGIGSADPYRPWLQPLIAELESALHRKV